MLQNLVRDGFQEAHNPGRGLSIACRVQRCRNPKKCSELAAEPRAKVNLLRKTMKEIVLAVCSGHDVMLNSLARLVNRDPDAFRQQYLKPLAEDGNLQLAFPTAPTHAKQAYRSVD